MRCIIALVPGGYEQAQDSAEDIERCKEVPRGAAAPFWHLRICDAACAGPVGCGISARIRSDRGCEKKRTVFLRQRRREITQHLLEFLGTPSSLQVASSDSCEARSGVGIDEFDPSQRSLEESILHKIGATAATPGNQLASCEM